MEAMILNPMSMKHVMKRAQALRRQHRGMSMRTALKSAWRGNPKGKISKRAAKHRVTAVGTPRHLTVSRRSRLATPGFVINPRRRKTYRRYRSNPGFKNIGNPKLLGMNVPVFEALGIVAGITAVKFVTPMLPLPAQLKTGLGKNAADVAVGLALGYGVSKFLKQEKLGKFIVLGAMVSVVTDLANQYVIPMLPAAGGVSAYTPYKRLAAYSNFVQKSPGEKYLGAYPELIRPKRHLGAYPSFMTKMPGERYLAR